MGDLAALSVAGALLAQTWRKSPSAACVARCHLRGPVDSMPCRTGRTRLCARNHHDSAPPLVCGVVMADITLHTCCAQPELARASFG